jgi:tellurite resistance protein TerC
MGIESVGSPALWVGFTVFVLLMLTLDLGVFHRQAHEVSIREAFIWTMVWIGLALLFNVGIYFWFGPVRGLEFLTGYLIEKALAIDNIFVFAVIFSFFAVPPIYQHRVLFWGILGALVMRALFILLGAALLHQFHWVIYVFGGFLILTGIKLLRQQEEMHPEHNPILRFFRRVIPSVSDYHGHHFFIVQNKRWYATPLFLVLVSVEISDVVFALDSIPAIFAVTRDPFIVYTSNIFAILGLRSLYFFLASVIYKFEYLKVGLALVLVFVGIKMVIADLYKLPIVVSLVVIAALIGGSMLYSLWKTKNQPQPPALTPHEAEGGPNPELDARP